MSMLFGWVDELAVPVLQVEKGKVKFIRTRMIHNSPLRYHWGEELSGYEYPVVIVEWRGKFSAADLRTPVVYKGVSYDASWASGSFVKSKKTYGFPVGFRPLPGAFVEEEQATKIGRALVPDCQMAMAGQFSVRTVANGTEWNGHPVEDGIGYIREGALPQGWSSNAISLKGCKQNYQIWQGLGTTKPDLYSRMLLEVKGYIQEWWNDWKQRSVTAQKAEGFRAELLELNPQLELHPYWVAPADEAISSLFRQASICPMFPQSMWLAVPAKAWTCVAGVYVASRYPITSFKGSRVVTTGDSPLEVRERDRIARFKGAIQVTLTAKKAEGGYCSYKMILVVIADEDWKENCDIVSSDENLKLFRGKRDSHLGVALLDGVLSILNVYGKDRLLGIPAAEFKEMTGDFDGDFCAIMPLDKEKFPWIIKAFESLPNLTGVKGKKTHTPIGDRGAADFLVNAMDANLGWGTNARSASFAADNGERAELAKRLCSAGRIPKPETWSLDIWLTSTVQAIVDSLKSNIDMGGVNGQLQEYNGILNDVIPAYPSYLRWKRSDWAWKRGRPRLYSELSPELHMLMKTDKDFAASEEMRSHVADETKGIAADIFRFNSELKIDSGESVLEAAWVAVGMTVEPRPLCHFKNWAPPVDESDIEAAKVFVTAFAAWNDDRNAAKAAGMYVSDDLDDIMEFNDEWRNTCASLARKVFGGDEYRACYALWHLLHSKASKSSQAAAVFKGFPGICRGIVEKAASEDRHGAVKTILVGMVYNFSVLPETFSGTVEVRGREVHSVEGHPLLNGTLVAVIGDINAKNQKDGYSCPLSGKYMLSALPFSASGKVWTATMSPIVEL